MTAGGEGASQEYLKNVVLNYMLSTDIASRNHMLKVKATDVCDAYLAPSILNS